MGADEYFACIESINLDLVSLFGSGYVIEHCISTYLKRQKDLVFRSYVADCLMNLNKSLASAVGGSYMNGRFIEMIDTKHTDTRTGDEIAEDIIKRAGLSLKEQ